MNTRPIYRLPKMKPKIERTTNNRIVMMMRPHTVNFGKALATNMKPIDRISERKIQPMAIPANVPLASDDMLSILKACP